MTAFPGFPPEGLQFFRSLARNNRREWFQPRKHIYDDRVKAPMTELVTALAAEMMRFAPDYVPEPAKAIYRIYRDTRFSKDKTPYKTHIAAIFPRRGLEKHAGAGLYFSVSPKEIEIAGGVYMPGPDQLLAIRMYLAERHQEFSRIVNARRLRTLMGELQGEKLSKPLRNRRAGPRSSTPPSKAASCRLMSSKRPGASSTSGPIGRNTKPVLKARALASPIMLSTANATFGRCVMIPNCRYSGRSIST